WADLLSYGPGVLSSSMVFSLMAVLTALLVIVVNAVAGMSVRRPMDASRRRALLVCQWTWLAVAALYALPWLWTRGHRLVSPEGLDQGWFLMGEAWNYGGSADHFNEFALWLAVTAAVPAILALVQLTRMPRGLSHPSATMGA
ncbi:MAG TPA: hypothetical protein VGF17_24380, partial [Phytomonospora sp.]